MKNSSVVCLGIVLLFAIRSQLSAQNQLAGDEVAARLEATNRVQAQALQAFEGQRVYRIQYRGLGGSRDAAMTVRMNFQAPASKRFTVVEQEGSKVMIDRVLKKLLQSEQEAMEEENRRRTALTLENYEFVVIAYENRSGGPYYVLQVTPRHANKFLYQGKIWVDAQEFAVVHIEAEPARNPSFWIKKTKIEHDYRKVEDFWFPAQNRTESQIRFGGLASLTIDYTDYKVTAVAAEEKKEIAEHLPPVRCQVSGSRVAAGSCSDALATQIHNEK